MEVFQTDEDEWIVESLQRYGLQVVHAECVVCANFSPLGLVMGVAIN